MFRTISINYLLSVNKMQVHLAFIVQKSPMTSFLSHLTAARLAQLEERRSAEGGREFKPRPDHQPRSLKTDWWDHATILDKINGKPRPPSPPNQGWENGARFGFCAASSLIWGGGGGGWGWGFAVPFYVVQDCSCETPFSIQMIASLGGDVKPLAFSLSSLYFSWKGT